MKNRDFEHDLKPFFKLFDVLSRRHGYYYLWEDFLTLFINGFSFDYCTKEDLEGFQKKYTKEERLKIGEMIKEVLFIMDKKITSENSWFDFFGTFYEIASLSKQNGFSQFFTPAPVCTFMAQILDPQSAENFSDPCCGSGRFSLAANSVNLGKFHFLVDLDFTCVKMAALNLMMHGIRGIVICDNSLNRPGKEFKGAFIINRNLQLTGIPQIEYIKEASQAYNFVRFNIYSKEDFEENKVEENKDDTFEDVKEILSKNGQYSLF